MRDDDLARRFLKARFKCREGILIAVAVKPGDGGRKELRGLSTKLEIEPELKPADALNIAGILGLQFESVLKQLAQRVGLSLDDFMDLSAELAARRMAEAGIEPNR